MPRKTTQPWSDGWSHFYVPRSEDKFKKLPNFEKILLQEEGPAILRLLFTAAHRVKYHGIRLVTEAQELRVHRYLCPAEPLEYWSNHESGHRPRHSQHTAAPPRWVLARPRPQTGGPAEETP